MISEKLKLRLVYTKRPKRYYNAECEALIYRAVRKLILLMRTLEVYEVMSREEIEDCVLNAIEFAEYLYYGLGEKEIGNDKGRKRNI